MAKARRNPRVRTERERAREREHLRRKRVMEKLGNFWNCPEVRALIFREGDIDRREAMSAASMARAKAGKRIAYERKYMEMEDQ